VVLDDAKKLAELRVENDDVLALTYALDGAYHHQNSVHNGRDIQWVSACVFRLQLGFTTGSTHSPRAMSMTIGTCTLEPVVIM
jgi:hypothetical protein